MIPEACLGVSLKFWARLSRRCPGGNSPNSKFFVWCQALLNENEKERIFSSRGPQAMPMACLGTSLPRSTRLLRRVSSRSACNSLIWRGRSLLSTAWDTEVRFEWCSYPKGSGPRLGHVWGPVCSRSTSLHRPASRLYAPFCSAAWICPSIAGYGIHADIHCEV